MGYDSDEELDDDTVTELASRIIHDQEYDDLPEGWEKQIDSTTNIAYYVNTITQTSQWSRPNSPAGNQRDDHHEVVKVIDDERRLFDSLSLMSFDGNSVSDHHSISKRDALDHTDRMASFVSTDNENENEAKDDSKPVAIEEIKPEVQETKQSAETVAIIAREPIIRKGILQKQGGLFGMWSKKFFVLEDDILSYYETSQSYLSGARPSKQMLLQASTDLSYTTMSHCFKVKTGTVEFILMSENKDLMREWIKDIRTIISALYDERIKSVMNRGGKK